MKKQVKRLAIIVTVTVVAFLIGRWDSALYPGPVGEITRVHQTQSQDTTDEFNNQDSQITQKLTVKMINRSDHVIHVENDYMNSQAMTTKFKVGDQVLLKKQNGEFQVDTIKRDSTLLALIAFFLASTFVYVRFTKMSFLLLSLVVNAAIFAGAILIDVHSKIMPVFLLFALLAIILAIVSLRLVLGRTKQARITLLSTIIATALAMGIMALVLKMTGSAGVHFETMSFVTQVPTPIFYAQATIGVLGAVMDESADIVAGLFGLHRESPHRPFRDYRDAGLSVGREILGTLTNVLFMIFIAETIPMVVLMLRNGNNWSYITDQVMNLGILQTVVSAIGIVWAVPVTAGITAALLRHRDEEEEARL
ncbi:YibE/F family protein [Fructobacillus ficulneus]|uniref:Transporter, YibE/F superfamily n=1 Tax=Fructobacillus ficulneus TaxID=157463 RepID=A0A0K8MGE4_9LACO|nr:YibE/F family protein [Fructobacillus ficulneus]GAO99626.1 transporter, YibE/F superfamily [Fructobacillus ficulneus]